MTSRARPSLASDDAGSPPIPAHCHLRISVAGAAPRLVVVRLRADVCPRTCRNFAALCSAPGTAVRPPKKGTQSSSSRCPAAAAAVVATYRGTEFHRIVPGFVVQGGDYENFDGSGGGSPISSGGAFDDENFDLKHSSAGTVSMANRGRDTNGSQFFFTLGPAHHLDGKHVVFGQVVGGLEVVREMGKVECEGERPVLMQRITVVDCGIGTGDDDVDVDVECANNEVDDRGESSPSSSSSESASSSDDRERGKRKERRKQKSERKRRKKRRRRGNCSSSGDDDGDELSSSSSYKRERRKYRRKRERDHDRDRSRRR